MVPTMKFLLYYRTYLDDCIDVRDVKQTSYTVNTLTKLVTEPPPSGRELMDIIKQKSC